MKYSEQPNYFSVLDPKVAGIQHFISKGDSGRFKLWFDPFLNREYEEYTVSAFGTEKDFETYQFRRDQWQNLIGVYHVTETDSFGFNQLRVFTERIPLLLGQMLTITFPDYLYILRESLIGFQAIVERFGYVCVNDGMIGINRQGKVRVWCNSKYEKNHPEMPIASASWMGSKKYECEMVRSLFEALDRHAESNQQFLNFQSGKPDNLGFSQATNYLFDYAERTGMTLPDELSFCHNELSPIRKSETVHSQCAQLFSKPSISTSDYISSSQSFEYHKGGEQNLCRSLHELNSAELFSSASEHNINLNESLEFTDRNKVECGDNTERVKTQWVYDPYKKTKYFGAEVNERKANLRFQGKSKQKVIIKCSWSSKDISFKSTTYSNQKKNFEKKNIFNRIEISKGGSKDQREDHRDESFMIESNDKCLSNNLLERPRSLICNLTSDHFQITKSVFVHNKPEASHNIATNKKSNSKNLSIQTGFNSDISVQNPPISAPSTPQTTKVRNLKSLTQFREISKSIIKPGSQKKEGSEGRGLAMISQLKTSFFNKLDDLKRSEIILEHFESSQCSSNVDLSSPLLCKVKPGALKAGNFEQFFSLVKCGQEQKGEKIFQIIEIEANEADKSGFGSKSRALNSIVEADGE